MGRMKEFAMQISEEMGFHGEINGRVMVEAQYRMEQLIDDTHDRLKDPEPVNEPVDEPISEPVNMMVKYGNNELEMIYNDFRLFFSYTTPVAACDPKTKTIYITDTKYSRTTSKHINRWISLVEEEEGDCSQVTLEKEIFLSLNKRINLGKIFKTVDKVS